MKIAKLLSVAMLAAFFVFATSCGDDNKDEGKENDTKKEVKKDDEVVDEPEVIEDAPATGLQAFADLLCEIQGISKEMMEIQGGEDMEKYEELTMKLEELNTQMAEMSAEIELGFEGDKDAEIAASLEVYTFLEGCEHYSAEEIQMMKDMIEQNQ